VDNQRLRARVDVLAARVEQLRRPSKRQAALFSKGTTVPRPRRPGRKAGTAYGPSIKKTSPARQRFARSCATRNLTSPDDPTLSNAFQLLGCVSR